MTTGRYNKSQKYFKIFAKMREKKSAFNVEDPQSDDSKYDFAFGESLTESSCVAFFISYISHSARCFFNNNSFMECYDIGAYLMKNYNTIDRLTLD